MSSSVAGRAEAAGILKRDISSSHSRPELPDPVCLASRSAPPPSGLRAGDTRGTHPREENGGGASNKARGGREGLCLPAPSHGRTALCSDPLFLMFSAAQPRAPRPQAFQESPLTSGCRPKPGTVHRIQEPSSLCPTSHPGSPLCTWRSGSPTGVSCLHCRLLVLTARVKLPPFVTLTTPLYPHS